MKTLTCRDLGGPCDAQFTGESFGELGKKSHAHVIEQMQKGDEAHLVAASNMRAATPEQQQTIIADYKRKFDEAPGRVSGLGMKERIDRHKDGSIRARGHTEGDILAGYWEWFRKD